MTVTQRKSRANFRLQELTQSAFFARAPYGNPAAEAFAHHACATRAGVAFTVRSRRAVTYGYLLPAPFGSPPGAERGVGAE